LSQVRDFGEDNFAIVKEFTTFFVRGERRRLFQHTDAGYTIESFSPFGSPAVVEKMMTNLREISNQNTGKVVLNLTNQLAVTHNGSQQAASARGRQRQTTDYSHPDTPKKGASKRDKGKRRRDAAPVSLMLRALKKQRPPAKRKKKKFHIHLIQKW
jgi:hypothetical protein